MAKISSLETNVLLNECLGFDDPDASDGILYQAKEKNRVSANIEQRTLIIGLGGQGIKTLNNIKKNVKAKFKDYDDRIAFLAIDTDAGDLKRQTALAEYEKHCIETDASTNTRYNIPDGRTIFTKSWIQPKFFADFTLAGANQLRQACIAKLFDEGQASNHNDAKVMEAIRAASKRVTEHFDPLSMRLIVHIIAGISGGTGSGCLVHMAHFVRRAIPQSHKIYGYVLLPDVVEQFLQGDDAQKNLYTNGYAALKELDYYYSLTQRTTADVFETSDPALGKMYFDYNKPLYDMVYLFSGSNGSSTVNPNKTAIETLTDSLLNLLSESQNANNNVDEMDGQLTTSFLANSQAARSAKLPNLYESGEGPDNGNEKGTFDCAEDVFNYNALGVASATIPEHTIKCYSVAKIMRTVFGKGNGFEAPAEFHGFSGTAMTAVEAAGHIKKLLAYPPLTVEKKIYELCDSALQWPEDFSRLSRTDILSGAESELRSQLKIEMKKGKVIEQLKEYIKKAYQDYRTALRAFLTEFGPMPYVKLYDGIDAAQVAYKNSMRSCLTEYKTFNLSGLVRIKPAVSARVRNEAYDKVKTPLFGGAPGIIASWHEAYRADQVMRLAEDIAGFVFGEAGIYRTDYLNLIETASQRVREFDFTLEKLSYVYENMGSKFDNYLSFDEAAVEESATNVNIIRAETDYQWAKEIVDKRARRLNYADIKTELIDSFMDNPEAWTEYDKTKPSVSPRRMLDTIMAPYVDTEDELTVISFLNHKLATGGDPMKIVNDLIKDLSLAAVPLYNADPRSTVKGSTGKSYLMVPKAMFLQEGGAEIRGCFVNVCRTSNIELFPSDMADKMVYYTLFTALPLYALADLKKWENVYDASTRLMLHANESGKGDYDPETGLAWEDYPALALERNPRLPRENGSVSREGRFLKNKLDPLFEECLNNGIIEKKTAASGGVYYTCYVLDRPGWDLSFNLREYNRKDEDGLYLTGAPVFEYLAAKNDASLESVIHDIELRDQGAFNAPTTDEKRALDRAKRALRRNVPLYRGLKKTLAIWKELGRTLLEANEEIRAGLVAKYIPYYVATGILAPNGKKQWSLNDYPSEGLQIDICSLNPLKLDEDDPLVKENCLYELLCRGFVRKMSADAHVATFYREAFDMMVDEPEIYAADYIKRMDVFKEEADAFTARAKSRSVTAQKALFKGLQMSEDEFEETKEHYARFLSLYNKIRQACPEA